MPDLSFKIGVPLRLEVDGGVVLTVQEWTTEGIVPPPNLVDDEGFGTLFLNFQGFEIGLDVHLQRDPDSNFMRFLDLSNRQRDLLLQFYRGLVTGQMEPVEDTIAAIDVPVEPVPMEETAEERKRALRKETPRFIRAAVAMGFYVALAVLVFGSLFSQFWHDLTTLDLRGAIVVAPVEEVRAPASLRILNVMASPGDPVKAGDIVAKGRDANVQKELDVLAARLALVDAELAESVTQAATTSGRMPRVYRGGFTQENLRTDVEGTDELDALRSLKATLEAERASLRQESPLVDIRAPADGIVQKVMATADSTAIAQSALMFIEGNQLRHVRGAVGEDDLGQLHLGQTASITFNQNGRSLALDAKVTAILRNHDSDGLIVEVVPIDMNLSDSRATLTDRMPVDVRLKRPILPSRGPKDSTSPNAEQLEARAE